VVDTHIPAGQDAETQLVNTGLLLFIPYRSMERRVFAALRDAGYADFTIAQARVFQRIAAGGSRLTDLAEQAQITKQSAGFLVDALARAGYVERIPDPTDARARLIVVAPRGTEMVARSAETVAQIEAEWEAHLGAGGMRHLRRLLSQLKEITDY
jgi:DNA-binding MarR family transcriptional regulator